MVDSFVHGVISYKTIDVDFSVLHLSVNSVDGLGLVRRVPMSIDYDGVGGHHQVEAGATSQGRDQEDSVRSRFLLNFSYDFFPFGH
jgi:hypothetical protein